MLLKLVLGKVISSHLPRPSSEAVTTYMNSKPRIKFSWTASQCEKIEADRYEVEEIADPEKEMRKAIRLI